MGAVLAIDKDEAARKFAAEDENLAAAHEALMNIVQDAQNGDEEEQPEGETPPIEEEPKGLDERDLMEFEQISTLYG